MRFLKYNIIAIKLQMPKQAKHVLILSMFFFSLLKVPPQSPEAGDQEVQWHKVLLDIKKRFEKTVRQFINGVLMASGRVIFADLWCPFCISYNAGMWHFSLKCTHMQVHK